MEYSSLREFSNTAMDTVLVCWSQFVLGAYERQFSANDKRGGIFKKINISNGHQFLSAAFSNNTILFVSEP